MAVDSCRPIVGNNKKKSLYPVLYIGGLGGEFDPGRPQTGKSISLSFRVRVVRASERARRSCVGA